MLYGKSVARDILLNDNSGSSLISLSIACILTGLLTLLLLPDHLLLSVVPVSLNRFTVHSTVDGLRVPCPGYFTLNCLTVSLAFLASA